MAAGSVVTKDVEAFAIVAGSPARFAKRRPDDLTTSSSADQTGLDDEAAAQQ